MKKNNPQKHGRARTPTVLQMEAVECGAAALAMILAYYGRIVSLEELRSECGVSRDGTKASNILKAARSYGMVAKGFSKDPAAVKELATPFIVFWNFNHFLVVEGFQGDRVYLNDPATGPRVVTEEEFDQAFTGVVLVFEPGPKFEKGGVKPSLWRALYSRLQGSKAGMLYVFLASFALSLLGLVVPLFGKVFVDYILVTRFNDWLMPLLIGMGVTCGLMTIITWLQHYYLLRLSIKLAVTSSYKFLHHVLRLPMEFFTQRYGGEVGSRMAINDEVANLISGQLTINALNVVMAVLYAAMMLYFDVLLAVISMALTSVNVAALRMVSRKRKDISVALLQEQGRMMVASMTGLQGIESVKATGGESDLFSRWAGHLAKVAVARQRMEAYSRGLSATPGFVTSVASIAILGVGAMRVIQGDMTIGSLVAFQALMYGFMHPVNQLVELGGAIQEVEGQLNRLDDVLRYDIDPVIAQDDKDGVALVAATSESMWCAVPAGLVDEVPKLKGKLDLQNITFGYSKLDPPLVERFNLVVKPGERVALVGSSGSGKSTMAKLISGLYQPWAGVVLMDGRPRMETPRSLVTNSVAMVDQDFFLYEGTLREVLTMWDGTIPEEDIIQAAKDACIHDDITVRPGGYDSIVEEGGRNFSSGQRQRLEIARSLVGKPTVLVLDEATSALDPVTEQRIDENLRRRGCTCVIIAHRLSTIRDCDEIVVLDRGRVVQRGPHEKLARSRGLYRELISTQD